MTVLHAEAIIAQSGINSPRFSPCSIRGGSFRSLLATEVTFILFGGANWRENRVFGEFWSKARTLRVLIRASEGPNDPSRAPGIPHTSRWTRRNCVKPAPRPNEFSQALHETRGRKTQNSKLVSGPPPKSPRCNWLAINTRTRCLVYPVGVWVCLRAPLAF